MYERVDGQALADASSPSQQIVTLIFVWGLLPALDRWPTFHAFFDLDLRLLSMAIVPFALAGIVFLFLYRRAGKLSYGAFLATWAGSVYLQFFAALLVVCGRAAAAPAMATLLVLTLLAHGQYLRYGFAPPWGPLMSLLGISQALWFAPTETHVVVVCFAAIAGVFGGAMIGQASHETDAARREHLLLKEALHSQELLRAENQLDAVAQVVVKLFGNFHDVRNVLMATKLNAECLVQEAEQVAPSRAEIKEMAHDIQNALLRLESTTEEVRSLAKQKGASLARDIALEEEDASDVSYVPLLPSIEAARQVATARFRDGEVTVSAREDISAARVRCVGGESTLRRVFENLLLNAFEGNGAARAKRVDVSVSWSRDLPWVEVTIADDGPGFPPFLLEEAIQSFATTKENGSGLGLFTCERLVRACGGTLSRSNLGDGGALVVVRLPREGGYE